MHTDSKPNQSPKQHAKSHYADRGTAPECLEPASSFDAREFLDSLPNLERTMPKRISPATFKLERMRTLLRLLGDPHTSLRCVHVAGSKGKGSICEMITAGLQGCEYSVGVFTSPHLVTPRERIRINDQPIDEHTFADILERVADATERHRTTRGNTTYFEVMTAAAFLYFAEQAVDAVALEVGLGGRLDSTNVVTPLVCVIGEIQLEHASILGDTTEAVALEKAGIIKQGVPVVTMEQEPSVLAVIEDHADVVGAPLYVLGRDLPFSWRVSADSRSKQHGFVNLKCPAITYEHIPVPLAGDHQATNCALALTAIALLAERGFAISEPDIVHGLLHTQSPGRMEKICAAPCVVIDGAHNPESIGSLMKTLPKCHSYDTLHVVFGCAQDKNIREMLKELATAADKVVFTRIDSARAADPTELATTYTEMTNRPAIVANTIADALHAAAQACTNTDLICVTGSFHLAGAAKAHVISRIEAAGHTRRQPVTKAYIQQAEIAAK